jgi:hypothetical protein
MEYKGRVIKTLDSDYIFNNMHIFLMFEIIGESNTYYNQCTHNKKYNRWL